LGGVFAGWWGIVPAVIAGALLSFYRDPQRSVPEGERLIVSPADGKVTEIARNVGAGEGDAGELRIVIFLSVFNVHINRAPCGGRVEASEHRDGKFLNALDPKSTDENESHTLKFAPVGSLPGPVLVRQIAGVLARRIVCVAKVGDSLSAGQRYGMIKLGSRTEIRLPESPDWTIRTRVGESVKAGSSVLAEWTDLKAAAAAPPATGSDA
jgi:phosphatidylserine decarboxylase